MSKLITTSDGPLTQEELVELFGETMPIEVVKLIFDAPYYRTIGALRRQLLETANGMERTKTTTSPHKYPSEEYLSLQEKLSKELFERLQHYHSGEYAMLENGEPCTWETFDGGEAMCLTSALDALIAVCFDDILKYKKLRDEDG